MLDLMGDEEYTLEDKIYESFHEATESEPATYDMEDFIELYDVAETADPTNLPEVDREDNVVGVAIAGNHDTAAYGFIGFQEDKVELDIKCFGDRSGVINYIENLPSEGYVEGVDSVQGQAIKNAAIRAGDHPMNIVTETEIDQPENPPEGSWDNSQARRAVEKVWGEEPRTQE